MVPKKRKLENASDERVTEQNAPITDDIPFRIALPPQHPPKKRKSLHTPACELQKNNFDPRLDMWYSVRRVSTSDPQVEWSSKHMKRYKRFQAGDFEYSVGDIVYVMAPQGQEPRLVPKNEEEYDFQDCWVANILECRAFDNQHVYLRVWWLYRPEDLPNGRQKYHAEGEVIPSNAMQIINAESVAGAVDDFRQLNETDYGDMTKGYHDLFWRQTLDAQSGNLSELQRICTCNEYANPDNGPLKCSDSACQRCMHPRCVERSVIDRVQLERYHQSHRGSPDSKLGSFLEKISGFGRSKIDEISETVVPETPKAKHSGAVRTSTKRKNQTCNESAETKQDLANYIDASLLPTSKGSQQVSITFQRGSNAKPSVVARCLFCSKDLQRQAGHAILDLLNG